MKFPADVYYRVVNISESYYILLDRLREIEKSVLQNIGSSSHTDGQPHGNQVGDPTAHKAEEIMKKQEECERKIKAVERAWSPLGPRYQDFIKQNLFEHKDLESIDLPMTPEEKKEVRKFFLYKVAKILHEI